MTHEAHCNQGEYVGWCKYGDPECPMAPPPEERMMYEGYDGERIGIAPEWAYNKIEWLEAEIKRLHRDANENYILIQDLREKVARYERNVANELE